METQLITQGVSAVVTSRGTIERPSQAQRYAVEHGEYPPERTLRIREREALFQQARSAHLRIIHYTVRLESPVLSVKKRKLLRRKLTRAYASMECALQSAK